MADRNSSLRPSEKRKLKVVWLCYFSNQFVQDQIRPWKRIDSFAPWISSMIQIFENDEDIELHIVSQHRWISGYKSFENKGVVYHFFNAGIPLIGRHWPGFFRFDQWTNFIVTKINFTRIVKKIAPDIIHVYGTENEFCEASRQFYGNFPVFVTIQGLIHKSPTVSSSVRRRSLVEIEILNLFNHFGYRTESMGEDIKKINPQAVLHWHETPFEIPKLYNVEKRFDLVFFARVCKDKGIEDLLQAVSEIKKVKPDISLCVIGGGKLDFWIEKAKDLQISNNVFWAGFLPTREDVHKMASTAIISVLPTYHDIISGTISESLFLKIPVVAYNVGSIHEVNRHESIISLVDKYDINGLVESILILLNNLELQKEIAEKGYHRAQEMFLINTRKEKVKQDVLNAYSEVIEDYHK